MLPFDLLISLSERYYDYPYFTDEETEACEVNNLPSIME